MVQNHILNRSNWIRNIITTITITAYFHSLLMVSCVFQSF